MYTLTDNGKVYYFRNLHIYNEAKCKEKRHGRSTISIHYMADVIVDTNKNEIIKCRYPLEEIVNGYYKTSMLISE